MNRLAMWMIYHGATDMPPGVWRVRRSYVSSAGIAMDAQATDHPTLEAARAAIPPGLFRQPRHPEDEPQIVEVWF